MVNAKVCHSWSRSQTPQDQGYLTQWLPGQLNEVKQIPSKQEGKLSYQEHMTKMNLLFHTFEPAVCVCVWGGDSQYLRCLGYLFFCCNAKYLAFFLSAYSSCLLSYFKAFAQFPAKGSRAEWACLPRAPLHTGKVLLCCASCYVSSSSEVPSNLLLTFVLDFIDLHVWVVIIFSYPRQIFCEILWCMGHSAVVVFTFFE